MKLDTATVGSLFLCSAGACLIVAAGLSPGATAAATTPRVPLAAVADSNSYAAFLWKSGQDGPSYRFEEEVNVEGFRQPIDVPYKSVGWFRMRSDGQIEAWVSVDEESLLNAVLSGNAARSGRGTASPKELEQLEALCSELTKAGRGHKWVAITE